MATHTVLLGTTAGLVRYAQNEAGTWQREATALAGQPVQALLVIDIKILLANVDGACCASIDGGLTWQASTSAPPAPIGLEVATAKGSRPLANPRLAGATAYARLALKSPMLLGAGAGGSMLFRSYDDGIHWEPAGMNEAVGRITAIIPASDQAEAAWATSDHGTLLRSGDGGQNWRVVAREAVPILCIAAVSGQPLT